MAILPAFVALIAFSCLLAIGRDALRRVTPDRIAWMIAFGLFGIAATTEVIGESSGWTELLARIYYVSGAILVVGYLALGQLYLLAGKRIGKFAPGVAILVTAVAISTVWAAPIDTARLDSDGWDALVRTPGLKVLAISVNTIGTLILLGGLLYSVRAFQKRGTHRNRMIGCLLIAVGTLTVAMGGTATRLGSEQILYVAMSIGISLIFAGYIWTRKPDSVAKPADQPIRPRVPVAEGFGADLPMVFIEGWLATLSDEVLAEECRVWSVAPREMDAFSRAEARRAWIFRTRLSAEGQTAFDQRPVSIRQQLTELYFDVLVPDGTPQDRPIVTALERVPRDIPVIDPAERVSGSVD